MGSASKRLGRPKALLELPNGRTMLEHVVAVASSVAEQVVILGEPPAVPHSLTSVPILPDARADCGPLGGLCSLLDHAAPHWGLLLACDLPALEAPVLEHLLDTAAGIPDVDVIAFMSPGKPDTYETCCALYHTRVHPIAAEMLRTGPAGLQSLLRRVRTHPLFPSERETRALFDVDTLQDLDTLGGLTV